MRENRLVVTVSTAELIETINGNREKHIDTFERAWSKYREAAIKRMTLNLEAAKLGKAMTLYVNLSEPSNHSSDYDRVLSMLRMHEAAGGDTIEIGQDDYAAYVMDDWKWKAQWETTNSAYLSRGE